MVEFFFCHPIQYPKKPLGEFNELRSDKVAAPKLVYYRVNREHIQTLQLALCCESLVQFIMVVTWWCLNWS